MQKLKIRLKISGLFLIVKTLYLRYTDRIINCDYFLFVFSKIILHD